MKSKFFLYIVLSILVLILSVFNIGIKSFVTSIYLTAITPSVVAGQSIYNNYSNFALALERSAKLDNLEQQVAKLSEKMSDYESLKDENKLLKSTLKIEEISFQDNQLILAQLIFVDKANAKARLLVSLKNINNIKQGNAVIVSNSLIGVVNKVNSTNVLVDLINNPNFVTEAININTNANGVVKGQLSQIIFSDVLNNEKLNLGDIVATSSTNGQFQKKYVLGKVEEVKSAEGEAFQTGKITSLINLTKLSKVIIVTTK